MPPGDIGGSSPEILIRVMRFDCNTGEEVGTYGYVLLACH